MKAVVAEKYGPPEVLSTIEVPKPEPGPDEILVRIYATTVTAGDVRIRGFNVPLLEWLPSRFYLGLRRPKRTPILGFEISGSVERVGHGVRRFRAGDEVYAHCGFEFGGYAEYKCLPEAGAFPARPLVARKPANLTHAQAAAVPVGGLAALNILRLGNIQPGQKVLVYGASGSVGTFAVQIARVFGAEITAVCGSRNMELVRSLGAATVFDYTTDDVTARSESYDLVFDAVGRSVSRITKARFGRVLKPTGKYLNVDMSRKDTSHDLDELTRLIEAGEVKPVVDRTYSIDEIVEAHTYVERGHKAGNVAITVAEPEPDTPRPGATEGANS